MTAIDNLAPYRNKPIKEKTQKLLDSEALEKKNAADNKSRLNIDKQLYKKS